MKGTVTIDLQEYEKLKLCSIRIKNSYIEKLIEACVLVVEIHQERSDVKIEDAIDLLESYIGSKHYEFLEFN
jgi:hypothetical protein